MTTQDRPHALLSRAAGYLAPYRPDPEDPVNNPPTGEPVRYRCAEEADAMQWTGTNAAQLRAFCDSDFDTIDPEDRAEDPDETAVVRSHKHGGWLGLTDGDWVVKHADHFSAASDEEFRARWSPAGLVAVPPTTTDRAALRNRIAAAIHADLTSTAYRRDGGLLGIVPRLADAVLAVLPGSEDTTTTRADTLALSQTERDMLRSALDLAQEMINSRGSEFTHEDQAAVHSLRRMADAAEDRNEREAQAHLDQLANELAATRAGHVAEVIAAELTRMDAMVWLGTRRGDRDHDEPIGQQALAERLTDALLRRLAAETQPEAPTVGDVTQMLTRTRANASTHDLDYLLRLIARWVASSEGRDVLVDELVAGGYRLPHACGNCEGIDPGSCLKNPGRLAHIGGGANAEDCPACHGTNPPYPFHCPGSAS